ncbi:hypothetical protein ACFB49_22700 [Sphingomonas sp. DBB INV C78]|uniref:DUF1588 domain-containing protein n=1 Tax=Sphingomonas sp. DBB INV C78 TaxID=3349434 RepID=UPI0036D39362
MAGRRNMQRVLTARSSRILLAGVAFMLVAASPPPSRTAGYVLANIYVASLDDDKACRNLSLSATDIFRDRLPAAEREKYADPAKVQELQKLMEAKLGFKMVPTGRSAGANGRSAELSQADLASLRQSAGIKPGKGIPAFLGTRFAYDSCTNPEDFRFMVKGNELYRGRVAYGIDLDGKISDNDFTGPDGEQGVDNELIRAAGCNFATRDFGNPRVADHVITSAAAPTLMEVGDIDDLADDPEVTISFYASASAIELTGSGKPVAWTSLDADPDARYRATVKARIEKGVLVSEPFDLRVRMREQIVDGYREIRRARIRAVMGSDGNVEGGIYGYHTIASIIDAYRQSTQVGANLTRMSCPALIDAVERHADAFRDARTGRNTAISSALRFRGTSAFIIKPTGAPAGGGGKLMTVHALRRSGPLLFAAAIFAISLTPSFSQVEAEAPADLPQLRRLTQGQYKATIADIFGKDISISGRFEPDLRVDGLLAAGTSKVSLTPAAAEQYEQLARGIAEQVTSEQHRARLVGCAPSGADPTGRACAASFFQRVGERLYRRPLMPAELRLATDQALAAGQALGDFHAGLAIMLTAMMTDLPFLFQVDQSIADPDAPGRRTLDAWSRASRISYFLWNSTPDAELLDAARNGSLMTRAGLLGQVDRLMASPRFDAGVRAFFDDFFQLEGLEGLAKDGLIYPGFRSAVGPAAREQTLRTVIDLLMARDGDYRDIFTTRSFPMNRTLSPLYRVAFASREWDMYPLADDDPRAGLLTQLSFLALHAHEGRTSPTLRGKAVREILMCDTVPTPPANVNFTIVQDVSNPNLKTTRERLQAHLSDEECASCHKQTDPIGLTLESFDGAGQFRTMENGVRIDTAAVVDKHPVADAAALGRALHDNEVVTRCAVKSAWRYAVGRPMAEGEDAVVERLHGRFAVSRYRLRALFQAIILDPAFFRMMPVRTPPARVARAAAVEGKKL